MKARKKATSFRRGRPRNLSLRQFEAGVIKVLEWALRRDMVSYNRQVCTDLL